MKKFALGKVGLMAAALTAVLGSAAAQTPKTIKSPGGGAIAYVSFDEKGTTQQAMVFMLRKVHEYFGAKPELGQFFQDKSGTTVCVFFKLTPTTMMTKPVAGLIMVSAPSATERSGAVVCDAETRFGKTLKPMLTLLNQEWPPAISHGGVEDVAAKPEPLQAFPFPDNSGEIGLPAGWRPVDAQGGAVRAAGPNGEDLYFGDSANNIDPTTARGSQQIHFLTMNGMQLPNHTFANPFRQSPAQSFTSVMMQRARKLRHPMPTIRITNTAVLKDNSIVMVGEDDEHDGRGPLALMAMVRVLAPQNGMWTMFMYHARVPVALASREEATVTSMFRSYHTNDKVILAMDQEIIRQIHARGDANTKAYEEREAARKSATGGTGDASEQGTAAVCNYILDRSVIGDSVTGGHATTSNDLADELVRLHPDRLSIVPPSQYVKGQDF